MGIVKIAVKDISGAQKRIQIRLRAIRTEAMDAIKWGARELKQGSDARAYQARQTNIQDTARYRKLSWRSPISIKLDSAQMRAIITCRTFWTTAKSQAIRNIASKYGLVRNHLWVNTRRRSRRGGRTIAGRPQHQSRDGLRKLPLKGRLYDWAAGRTRSGDVGDQHRVSIIQPRGEALRRLVLGAAVRKDGPRIVARIRAAVDRAVREGAIRR